MAPIPRPSAPSALPGARAPRRVGPPVGLSRSPGLNRIVDLNRPLGLLRMGLLRMGLLVAATVLGGCGGPGPFVGGQAHYQTAFPQHDTSGDLERAFASIRRVLAEVTYETYLYPPETAPTRAEVEAPGFRIEAPDTVRSQQDRASTAVVVARRGRRYTLLTVNHGVDFPDTIVEYQPRAEDPVRAPGTLPGAVEPERRVERISVKTLEVFRIFGLPDLRAFQVLARAPLDDLALLGVELPVGVEADESPVLPFPAGQPDRLSWGSFVYVLGYPQGYPMATRGIVSAPGQPIRGNFLVDGLWNRGMSGGAIFALRGDGRGMEWVGVARAAAASTEVRVRPFQETLDREEVGRLYTGPLFLDQVSRIQYGITLSIPMTTIRTFLDRERAGLEAQGWAVPRL
jgi:hypothetical protein